MELKKEGTGKTGVLVSAVIHSYKYEVNMCNYFLGSKRFLENTFLRAINSDIMRLL
jgi:hypothetical protein